MRIDNELINSFIEAQLETWELARRNFFNLSKCRRKSIDLGQLQAAVQLNPARIVSTGADVSREAVAARPCFLCAANRPKEQMSLTILPGWDMLVNPYPILPVHFTISSQRHVPQNRIPLDIAAMAETAPGLVFFFNGAKAGASAPDHLHVQAVLKSELPLIRLAERIHTAQNGPLILNSEQSSLYIPFRFTSALIPPNRRGMETLANVLRLCGRNPETGEPDPGLVNAFFWTEESGLLRCIIVPRRAHRPECYGLPAERGGITVSPGAIDMAGLIITPHEEDFDRMDSALARSIYADVAYT